EADDNDSHSAVDQHKESSNWTCCALQDLADLPGKFDGRHSPDSQGEEPPVEPIRASKKIRSLGAFPVNELTAHHFAKPAFHQLQIVHLLADDDEGRVRLHDKSA